MKPHHSLRMVCAAFRLFGGPDSDRTIDILAPQQTRRVAVRFLLDPLVSYSWLPPAPLNVAAVNAP